MKKVVVTILTILYLGTSTGATVNIHYCMGKLYSVDLDHTKECGKCGMEKGDGDCCKDETKLIKVNDTYKPIQQEFSFVPFGIVSAAPSVTPFSFYTGGSLNSFVRNNSPPPAQNLCIFHCVFRI